MPSARYRGGRRRVRARHLTIIAATSLLVATACGQWVVAAAASATAVPVTAWPSEEFNSAGSNVNKNATGITADNLGRVRYTTVLHPLPGKKDPSCSMLFAERPHVVLSQDSLYTLEQNTLTRFRFTGGVVWRTQLAAATSYFGLSVVGNVLTVAGNSCGTTDPNTVVEQYRTGNGSRVFSVASPNDGAATLAVAQNRAIVGGFTDESGYTGYAAVNLQAHKVKWRSPASGPRSLCAAPTRVVDGVVIGSRCDSRGAVTAQFGLETTIGSERGWELRSPGTVVRGDRAEYSDGNFVRRDPQGVFQLFSASTSEARPVLRGATAVFALSTKTAFGRCGATTVCVWDARTGTKRWSAADPGHATSGIVGGSLLYLGDGLVLRTSDGTKAGMLSRAPSAVGGGPDGHYLVSVAGDTVYLGTI